jgi:head-tail adaptor
MFTTGEIKARKYNDRVSLSVASSVIDEYGHEQIGSSVPLCLVPAMVQQMDDKTAMYLYGEARIRAIEIVTRYSSTLLTATSGEWGGVSFDITSITDIDNRHKELRIFAKIREVAQ